METVLSWAAVVLVSGLISFAIMSHGDQMIRRATRGPIANPKGMTEARQIGGFSADEISGLKDALSKGAESVDKKEAHPTEEHKKLDC